MLGYQGAHDGETAVRTVAKFIHDKIKISGVVVHPRAYAVAASADGVVKADGPFIEKPLISTGAGDHFNAGFCLGKLIGADNEISLQTRRGHVRAITCAPPRAPDAMELADFLQFIVAYAHS